MVVIFADMDLLQGPVWYRIIFNFKQTMPYNSQYGNFGIDNLNLFDNTGSMLIIFVLMVTNWLFWTALERISKIFYENKWFRKMGVYSSYRTPLRIPVLNMAVEGYTDLILASLLGTFDLFRSFTSWELFQKNFSNFSNIIATLATIIVTILVIILPIYIKHSLTSNFSTLREKETKKKYGVFYS